MRKKNIELFENAYSNGYLERCAGGKYEGMIEVDGVSLSPIDGLYFKEKGKNWLWVKRKETIEYDYMNDTYIKRKANPYWECYMEKQRGGDIAYVGYFVFCHFRYVIKGIWDRFMKDVDRINFYVERLPMSDQTIINNINLKNKEKYENRK